ncbi:hypothetical protein GCM10023231_07680 [Olivibacter ginsenosidimutans]|uniref:Beta-lactamase-inhibitor-like PepSY-like domain-containing protein n=1 Tax=Olivibacter ginsenosidimutans TaxID=1176537 RepID=A0ABP9AKH8_9SPHI
MKKFVLIAAVLSLTVSGFNVKAGIKDEGQKSSTAKDSLIVYEASNDSLKAALVSTNEIKPKACVNFKRMESAFDDEKTPVHPRDLPSAIKETLSGDKFRGWKTTSVSFVKPVKGKSYYEIALLKDNDSQIAKFKDNGKVL